MAHTKLTLGQAIDQILSAIKGLDDDEQRTAMLAVSLALGWSGAQEGVLKPHRSGSNDASLRGAPKETINVGERSDIRHLKDRAGVASARDMACLVAYYLREKAPQVDKKDSITSADLDRYFREAGYRLPERIQQVLIDAKKSGMFNAVARGEYQLNSTGYNYVVHEMLGNN